ncbi:MAG TPA: TonB-dependent receptor [Bryobacteraceae bacterium]|nr:TonB-dependent receptor [Bryobacteraceae bacterium]
MRLRVTALVFLTVSLGFSQGTTATLDGIVHDQTGAVVPGAAVTVTNTHTGVSTSVVSNAEGDFVATFLLPGEYQATVEKPGFKKTIRSGITLSVGDTIRIDLALEVGTPTENVTVSAEAPLVKADTSELGQVVQQKPIEELPLNSSTGRNFTALMTLIPGAIRTNPVGTFDAPQGNSSFAVNGQRDSENNYMVDGADNNEVLLGIVTILPPPEALSEFKIQTDNYSAEFGRAGGAVINVDTRSGTNEIHGSAFEFDRNSYFSGRGPFDPATLPPYRQNEWGGTLGGPIRKNRLFIFGDYEGFRQAAGTTYIASVPTANQRNGIFLASEGAGTIYDPFSGAPFPNNTIPTDRTSPVGQALLNLFPLPNLPGVVSAGNGVANNYTGPVVQTQHVTRVDTRVDAPISAKDSMFVRYSIFNAFTALPPLFGPMATGNVPGAPGQGPSRDQSVVLSEVHVFSPTFINEARFSYSRIRDTYYGYDYGQNLATQLGIPNINVFGPISTGLPIISIAGLSGLGTEAPIPAIRYENSFEWIDNVTWIHGNHRIKFGADIHRMRDDFYQISLASPRGQFNFDQNYTSNAGASRTGLGIASTLLGYPATESRGVIYDFPSNRIFEPFFFVQDDIKVTQKLTINLGLRYELYFPPTDAFNNQSNFDRQNGQMLLAGRGGNSAALVNLDANNFAPRFGFAYAWKANTVIRGGYGISYFPDKFGATGGTLNDNYPFISFQTVTPPSIYLPSAQYAISNGIPSPVLPNLNQASVPLIGSATYFDPNYKMGYVQFWNLTVQRQLTKDTVLEVSYVGNRGTHLFGNNHFNLNLPMPGPGAVVPRQPFYSINPLATSINLRDSSEWSNYEALQAKFQKRLNHGFWLLFSYAYAKSLDDATTSYNPLDWDGITRGPSANDFRHAVTISSVYELPIGRGRALFTHMNPVLDAIIGGWQANGIYTFRTGVPSTATLSSALASQEVNTGGSDRPNQIAQTALPSGQRSLLQYFNTAAFAALPAASYTFGNAGRDTIRGPSFSNLDCSMFKNFRIKERYRLQVRGEFFNVANHPNYGNPGASFGTATFGTITSLAGNANMRQVQLGAKILF